MTTVRLAPRCTLKNGKQKFMLTQSIYNEHSLYSTALRWPIKLCGFKWFSLVPRTATAIENWFKVHTHMHDVAHSCVCVSVSVSLEKLRLMDLVKYPNNLKMFTKF